MQRGRARLTQRLWVFQRRISLDALETSLATDRVAKFLGRAGLIPMPVYPEQPKQSAPKKKAQERAKEAAAAAGA